MVRSSGRDDGQQTELQPNPLATPAQMLRRRRPSIRWTDAGGSHTEPLERTLVVGSAAGADIVLDDPAVSRLHAEIDPKLDGIRVRDLGSRNGTFVEGLEVVEARLPEGGRVRVGSTELTITYSKLTEAVDVWPQERFGPLVGRSVAMRQLFERLARYAAGDASVLIQGETGTGKELVAQALHENSPRKDGPFIVVDCAALPETLLESELFGHIKGAFTGALQSRNGAIESADGGTVFLDEIGELPLAMQPKLLRVLESRTVRRVGEAQHRRVDVRFISATHRDLRTMVNAGAFREDLYFRLAVLPVVIPTLRSRPEDIPVLLEHMLPSGRALDPALTRELAARPWLGNVRELRNFVERALAVGPHDALAMVAGEASAGGTTAAQTALPAVPLDVPFKDIREQWIEHLEREYLKGLLQRHDRNISAVAEAAGLTRVYVYKLMHKHGL
jgi:transcriptional regulator with PAS, ATPase and Fis domain